MNASSLIQVGDIFITPVVSHDLIESFDAEIRTADSGPGWHYHEHMDEVFRVISGEVTITSGGVQIVATPGMVVHVPRRTPHSWKSLGGPARLLFTFLPGRNQLGYLTELGLLSQSGASWEEGVALLRQKYDSVPCPQGSGE